MKLYWLLMSGWVFLGLAQDEIHHLRPWGGSDFLALGSDSSSHYVRKLSVSAGEYDVLTSFSLGASPADRPVWAIQHTFAAGSGPIHDDRICVLTAEGALTVLKLSGGVLVEEPYSWPSTAQDLSAFDIDTNSHDLYVVSEMANEVRRFAYNASVGSYASTPEMVDYFLQGAAEIQTHDLETSSSEPELFVVGHESHEVAMYQKTGTSWIKEPVFSAIQYPVGLTVAATPLTWDSLAAVASYDQGEVRLAHYVNGEWEEVWRTNGMSGVTAMSLVVVADKLFLFSSNQREVRIWLIKRSNNSPYVYLSGSFDTALETFVGVTGPASTHTFKYEHLGKVLSDSVESGNFIFGQGLDVFVSVHEPNLRKWTWTSGSFVQGMIMPQQQ